MLTTHHLRACGLASLTLLLAVSDVGLSRLELEGRGQAPPPQGQVVGGRGPQITRDNSPVRIASAEVTEAVAQFYEYDRTRPLRAEVREKRDAPTYTRERIVFEGLNGVLVPAYLALPKTATGAAPVILLIDGVGGSKERWFQEDSWPRGATVTNALTGAGYAVMALDARYHGERASENGYRSPSPDVGPVGRDMVVPSTVEHRRALDYLATRPEIDSNRVGLVGLSMGGMMAFALSAVEPRIKVAVAGVTPVGIMKQPIAIPVAPQTFAGGIKTVPFLMMMGRRDGFYSAMDAEQLFAGIPSTTKELVWYDSGHQLPSDYAARALEWLKTYLR